VALGAAPVGLGRTVAAGGTLVAVGGAVQATAVSSAASVTAIFRTVMRRRSPPWRSTGAGDERLVGESTSALDASAW
jgi:hypothetical protein